MGKAKRFKTKGKRVKNKRNKFFYIMLIIIFLSILVYNVYVFINWIINKKVNEKEISEISQSVMVEEVQDGENVNPPEDAENDYWNYIKMPLSNVNIEELQKINSDTIGYVSVGGTNINYPVVQTTNNSYYLGHSFKRERNSAGWVFMDYRNNASNLDRNTIIYGHSRLDSTMFGTLKNILKTGWLNNKDNYIVKLSTLKENTLWQVFSIYTIPVESYYITTSFNNKQYEDWLNTMISRSEYNFNTTVNTNDKVLTLSTCYGNSDKRVILQAKLIKRADK